MPTLLSLDVTVSQEDLRKITIQSDDANTNSDTLTINVRVAFPSIVIDEMLRKLGDQAVTQQAVSQYCCASFPTTHGSSILGALPLQLKVSEDNVMFGTVGTLDQDDGRPLPTWMLPLTVSLSVTELVNILLDNQWRQTESDNAMERSWIHNIEDVLEENPHGGGSATASLPSV